MDEPSIILFLGTAALAIASVLITTMLRIGGIGREGVDRSPGGWRGTAIVGGIVAGVLAGPGVLGQVAPSISQRVFAGGTEQREAYDDLLVRQRADIAALLAADVTGIAIEEQHAAHDIERTPFVEAIDAAEAERRSAYAGIKIGRASCRERV